MKNTRTQRASSDLIKRPNVTWVGNHKYWNDFQLKTSRGDYK